MPRLELFEQKACALGADVLRVATLEDSAIPAGENVFDAELGVAETGSVLVCLSNADRSAAMLAEHLWLIVHADSVVDSLDEAIARIGALIASGEHYATLMSGPSRTADIERTLTIGVHGPRVLTVVLVER